MAWRYPVIQRSSDSSSISDFTDEKIRDGLGHSSPGVVSTTLPAQTDERSLTIFQNLKLYSRRSFSMSSEPDPSAVIEDSGSGRNVPYKWNPHPLRTSFILANIISFIVVAFVIEILYALNRKDYGWVPPQVFLSQSQAFSAFLNVAPGIWPFTQ